MSIHEHYAGRIRSLLQQAPLNHPKTLSRLLWQLSRWRTNTITAALVERSGPYVQGGPFQEMKFLPYATSGSILPRLLGVYEAEIQADLSAFTQEKLDCILDIGCAEGYYAVGLARIMPEVRVYAWDTDPAARKACRRLAEENGVEDRLEIGETFTGAEFERFIDRRTLVFIDAEGFEDEVLDPERFPALRNLSVIVEAHPGVRPGVTERLVQRFEPTHQIVIRRPETKEVQLPEWIRALPRLDQLLCLWDLREYETPWLIMRPRAAGLP